MNEETGKVFCSDCKMGLEGYHIYTHKVLGHKIMTIEEMCLVF